MRLSPVSSLQTLCVLDLVLGSVYETSTHQTLEHGLPRQNPAVFRASFRTRKESRGPLTMYDNEVYIAGFTLKGSGCRSLSAIKEQTREYAHYRY